MSSRQTTQKVREFELNLEDAGRLAECLNSFDDSDSWPGGFTHGNPFTAERVLDEWSKENNIRVIVGYSDDKIVGHCNVGNAELDAEAAYVGLLGVNPNYQGQGFGKAMLIEAAQAAADVGKRRIDLHTWGGNLKAVPLYKRVGYNWVPGTRVLMESHIPGIIGADMFREFFERYDWYDSLKVDVTQEMDDFKEDEFGVFRYHFEGNNGDLLHVTVDREAKGICGFKLTLDGNTISADVRPKEHVGYIGLGSTDIKLKLSNSTNSDQEYSISFHPVKDISLSLEGELDGKIESQGEIVLNGKIAIHSQAIPLDKETNTFEKAKTQGEFVLTFGNRTIKMYTGLIPTAPIVVNTGSRYHSLSPGEESVVGLSLQNNTDDVIIGALEVSFPTHSDSKKQTIDFQIEPKFATEIPLTITTTLNDDNSVLPIQIGITVDHDSEKVLLTEKVLNLPVIGASGAVVYESLGDYYFLENESLRIGLRKTPSMAINYVEYKHLNQVFTGWGILPDIGYPFSGEGAEWYRTEFEVKMHSSEKTAQLELIAESEDRPGLKYTIIHRIHAGLDYVETIVRLQNNSSKVMTNLGVQTYAWFRFGPDQMYVPLRNQIYSLDSVDWNGRRQLPRKPEVYHENWVATSKQSIGFTFGWIWQEQFIEQVTLRRGASTPVFEYKLGDLKPGETVELTPCRFVITQGNWEKVRSVWARTKGTKESVVLDELPNLRSDLEFEIVRKGTNDQVHSISPILVDRARENDMEFRLRVVHQTPLTAEGTLRMPEGILVNGKQELAFSIEEVSIDKPYHLPLKVSTSSKSHWFLQGGEVLIKFPGRIERTPLDAVLFDSSMIPKRVNTVEGESELMTTSIGGYQIAVSPQNIGGLVRYGRVGELSMFFDTFPKVGPFIWWDKVYSGVTPRLEGFDVWDWESGLYKENWDIKEVEYDSWVGYELKSTLAHSPKLKGVIVTQRYLLLSGTPLIRLETHLENKSGLWKRPYVGFRCHPTPGGDVQSRIHTYLHGKRIVYEPTGNEAQIWAQPEAGWGAYEGLTSNKILGIVSTIKNRESLALDTLGEKAHNCVLRSQPSIRNGAVFEAAMYMFDADTVDQVERLRNLPTKIE